jgi:hypothetical protein
MKSDSKAGRLLGVKGARFSAETDAQLFSRAQKELAAFVAAVTTLHGEEQARAAADDWLLELIALKEPCNGAFLDLRSVTIGAAIRLALRFSIPSPAAIQISVRKKTSSPQRRGKKLSPAQENGTHATMSGKISHAGPCGSGRHSPACSPRQCTPTRKGGRGLRADDERQSRIPRGSHDVISVILRKPRISFKTNQSKEEIQNV